MARRRHRWRWLAGRGGEGVGAVAGHREHGQAEPPCRAGWCDHCGLLLGCSTCVGVPLSESEPVRWTGGPDARPQVTLSLHLQLSSLTRRRGIVITV